MRLVFTLLISVFMLAGCGKSKLQVENDNLREKISAAESRLQDAQSAIESAKSSIDDLQDKIRSRNFYGILGDLDDIGSELDSAESEIEDALSELN